MNRKGHRHLTIPLAFFGQPQLNQQADRKWEKREEPHLSTAVPSLSNQQAGMGRWHQCNKKKKAVLLHVISQGCSNLKNECTDLKIHWQINQLYGYMDHSLVSQLPKYTKLPPGLFIRKHFTIRTQSHSWKMTLDTKQFIPVYWFLGFGVYNVVGFHSEAQSTVKSFKYLGVLASVSKNSVLKCIEYSRKRWLQGNRLL